MKKGFIDIWRLLLGWLSVKLELRQGQSATTRGSSCDDFKMLGPPYFSSTSDPTEAEAWITKIETFFYVIDYSDE